MGVAERKAREFKRREQEILDVSLRLFVEKGPDSVTIDMIAEEVEIGKGTIYQHFKSKHEIFAQLLLNHFDQLQWELDKIDTTLPNIEQLQQVIRVYINFWLNDPVKHKIFRKCMHSITPENLGPKLLNKVTRYHRQKHYQHFDLIQKSINEGLLIDLPPVYITLVAAGLMSGVAEMLAENHFELKTDAQTEIDSEILSKTIETVLLTGLLKKPE